MCGILGGNNKIWNYEKSLKSIFHRGPDGSRIASYDYATMAFTRLSIMDVSERGMQPMSRNNVTIVYNGEIYGYEKLKNELQKKYEFASGSDTEVVLYAYIEYGERFIDKIDGMFAIAILDHSRRKFILYRDRTGIKPLYYYFDGRNFAFASELKAIEALFEGNISLKIDYTGIYDYLFYQYIPEPKTMYKNCYKLEPAHKLVFDLNENKIVVNDEYWKLKIGERHNLDKNEAYYRVRQLIRQSVREQLVADVPVGVFLSGGIDSSVVTYEASRVDRNIKTFSMGFDEKKYDETSYAELLVKKYDLNSFRYYMKASDYKDLIFKLKEWYDEPFADTSAFPSYLISKKAREEVTVVLTGDGGDEIFGGYERYSYFYDDNKDKVWDSRVIAEISKNIGLPYYISSTNNRRYIQTSLDLYKKYIFLTEEELAEKYKKQWGIDSNYDILWHLRKYYIKDLPLLTRMRYLDMKTYLPGDILTKVDRVSMANSLETRVPFLSRRIIEFAFSLPDEWICKGNNLKEILKEIYIGEIPEELLFRRKKGFSIPGNYHSYGERGKSVTEAILKENWESVIH